MSLLAWPAHLIKPRFHVPSRANEVPVCSSDTQGLSASLFVSINAMLAPECSGAVREVACRTHLPTHNGYVMYGRHGCHWLRLLPAVPITPIGICRSIGFPGSQLMSRCWGLVKAAYTAPSIVIGSEIFRFRPLASGNFYIDSLGCSLDCISHIPNGLHSYGWDGT